LSVGVLAFGALTAAPIAAQAGTPGPAGGTATSGTAAGVNPYAPAYQHPYRHGAVPTIQTAARMKAYANANGTAASTANLSYRGGNDGIGVTTGPERVYLVFWGSQWGGVGTDGNGYTTLSGDPAGEGPRLQAMYKGLGTGNEQWSGVMTQYCEGVASGAQSCPNDAPHVAYPAGGTLADVWVDESGTAPAQASGGQLAQEAVNAAQHFGNTSAIANRNAQYVVLSPTGTHPDNFPSAGFCAWHSWAGSSYGDIAYHNMPYVPDAGGSCGQNAVNGGGAGSLDGVTIVDGHEYAETITDQNPAGGWLDSSGAENGDKCSWRSPGTTGGMGNLTLSNGTFAMQGTWSNDANGGAGDCAFTHGVVANSVSSGAVPSGIAGKCLDDYLNSSASGAMVDLYDCNGSPAQHWAWMPDGTLRINGKCLDVAGQGTGNGALVELWDCDGLANQRWSANADGRLVGSQSGRCLDDPNGSTANTTQLEIWDCNGGVNQQWPLPTATGPITGYSGLCVDDRSSATANFNPVQGWSCNNSSAQQWTAVPNGSTLHVFGKCLDVSNAATANGSPVAIYDCNGSGSQVWIPQPNGLLLNPQSGRCLDDTGWATTPGTQLELWDCTGWENQRWNLP
jgi:serine protease